jgi:hypothetical protein
MSHISILRKIFEDNSLIPFPTETPTEMFISREEFITYLNAVSSGIPHFSAGLDALGEGVSRIIAGPTTYIFLYHGDIEKFKALRLPAKKYIISAYAESVQVIEEYLALMSDADDITLLTNHYNAGKLYKKVSRVYCPHPPVLQHLFEYHGIRGDYFTAVNSPNIIVGNPDPEFWFSAIG